MTSSFDPLGSYTGNSVNEFGEEEAPTQDVDDL